MKGTDLLKQEHGTIEHVANACDVFAEMLQNGTKVPVDVLQNVAEFLRVFCDDYHHEQEAWFFAMLRMKGFPSKEFPMESLRREHDRLALLTHKLKKAVDVYAASDGRADAALISTLRALAELYSDHIWKENYVLLPIAEELFTATDQRVLADTLHMVNLAKGTNARWAVEQLRSSIGLCPECNEQEPRAV